MIKKFELDLSSKITVFGIELFRIKALISFSDVEKGELGGYVEKEENLSHSGNAWVYDDARVSGNAWVSGNAEVSKLNDYIVFKNNWSSGRYFTYTRSNKMWRVGCFYGTGEELIKRAYQDSKDSGKHYEAYVNLVKTLEQEE
nr:MAG TPA: Putative transferase, nesg, ydcK, Structural Genomics.38A [Bacteriophage sp.]